MEDERRSGRRISQGAGLQERERERENWALNGPVAGRGGGRFCRQKTNRALVEDDIRNITTAVSRQQQSGWDWRVCRQEQSALVLRPRCWLFIDMFLVAWISFCQTPFQGLFVSCIQSRAIHGYMHRLPAMDQRCHPCTWTFCGRISFTGDE